MRTAASWIDVVHPAAHFGATGELERQIKRIQADAINHAIEVTTKCADNMRQDDPRTGDVRECDEHRAAGAYQIAERLQLIAYDLEAESNPPKN